MTTLPFLPVETPKKTESRNCFHTSSMLLREVGRHYAIFYVRDLPAAKSFELQTRDPNFKIEESMRERFRTSNMQTHEYVSYIRFDRSTRISIPKMRPRGRAWLGFVFQVEISFPRKTKMSHERDNRKMRTSLGLPNRKPFERKTSNYCPIVVVATGTNSHALTTNFSCYR